MAEASSSHPPPSDAHDKEDQDVTKQLSSGVTHSIFRNGRYENPWDTWEEHSLRKLMKWVLFDKNNRSIPSLSQLDETLPVQEVDYGALQQPVPDGSLRVIWIGHASTLVQVDGITILTDPIFSDTCGPRNLIGRTRYRPCPMGVTNLPNIDAVFISHSHYDHMDARTIQDLNQRFGEALRWFVPLGLKKWFLATGCENVVEMDWWQESCLDDHPEIVIALTPTQHWSRRTATDYCKSLWGSWVIKGPSASYFFAGDTGYCSSFKEIGVRYGPFTLAALPIGAYEPVWFKKAMHISPEEAAQIHVDVRATKSLGMHWGTFPMGSEFYLDPPKEAKRGMEELGLDPEDFIILQHGQAVIIEDLSSKTSEEPPKDTQGISEKTHGEPVR